jgi:Arginase family
MSRLRPPDVSTPDRGPDDPRVGRLLGCALDPDGQRPGSLWLAAAEAAGAKPLVRSADVVELNPAYDLDGRTARLAALTVWRLLRGVASRR